MDAKNLKVKFIVCGTKISLNYEISNSNHISNNKKLRTNTKRNDNINKKQHKTRLKKIGTRKRINLEMKTKKYIIKWYSGIVKIQNRELGISR